MLWVGRTDAPISGVPVDAAGALAFGIAVDGAFALVFTCPSDALIESF